MFKVNQINIYNTFLNDVTKKKLITKQ